MATIFVVGASIALGAGDPKGGWASRLREMIDARVGDNTVSKNLVYNLGISSETTVGLLSRIDAEMKARCRPGHTGAAIFSIGGNDAAYDTKEQRFRVPPDEFKDNMGRLIRIARQHCPLVLVQNLTPVVDSISSARVGSTRSKLNAHVDMYNSLVVDACTSSGATIVDVHGLFVHSNYKLFLCDDGVHPNGRGHAAIARLVASQLAGHLPHGEMDAAWSV